MKGSAAEFIVKYLEQEGVEYVFGVPGGHLLPLYDAIHRAGTIKPVLTRHEQGAAFMACGYALAAGKVGVCCGTVGPGATNLTTGIAAAFMDSIPVLALTAQVGTTAIGKGALQESAGVGRTINQVALFDKITKLSLMEVRGSNVPGTIRRALRVAQSGRPGPVHIDLPADVQGEPIEEAIIPPSQYRPLGLPAVDPTLVKKVVEYLLAARKPAILVGAGAMAAAADGTLVAIAERLNLPVATTLRAKGCFPEDHPLALGCVGLYGTKAANVYMRSGLDVLLALGSSLHEFTTHCWDSALIPSTALIQVDVDPTEIGKNYPVNLGIVGDARTLLRAMAKKLGDRTRAADEFAQFKQEAEYFQELAMSSESVPLKPQRVMQELQEVLPRDVTLLADIGNSLTWVERCFPSSPEGRFFVLSGLAAMGSATAACVGAKLGRPASPAVCVCGDGDFQMTGMEVATAADCGQPVVWVVLRNDRLGMVHDVQTVSYQGRHAAATFRGLDFVALARCLGARGYRAQKPGEVREAVAEALRGEGPAVVEVPIDVDEMPPMKPRMLALQRSLGLPDPLASFSWDALKALWRMGKER